MPYEEFNPSEMTCASFKSRLNTLLDARRLPQLDIQLRSHARHCPQCKHWLTTQLSLLEALPTTPAEPSADFAVRVLQTVEIQRCDDRHWRWRAAAFASAATVLIAALSWRSILYPSMVNQEAEVQSTKLTAAVWKRVDQVATNFRPVTGSVYTAFNALWLANRLL